MKGPLVACGDVVVEGRAHDVGDNDENIEHHHQDDCIKDGLEDIKIDQIKPVNVLGGFVGVDAPKASDEVVHMKDEQVEADAVEDERYQKRKKRQGQK
jgi:hypothetical protein